MTITWKKKYFENVELEHFIFYNSVGYYVKPCPNSAAKIFYGYLKICSKLTKAIGVLQGGRLGICFVEFDKVSPVSYVPTCVNICLK